MIRNEPGPSVTRCCDHRLGKRAVGPRRSRFQPTDRPTDQPNRAPIGGGNGPPQGSPVRDGDRWWSSRGADAFFFFVVETVHRRVISTARPRLSLPFSPPATGNGSRSGPCGNGFRHGDMRGTVRQNPACVRLSDRKNEGFREQGHRDGRDRNPTDTTATTTVPLKCRCCVCFS